MNAHVGPPPVGAFWRGVARVWRFDLARFRVVIALAVALELLRATFVEWTLHYAPFGFASTAGDFRILDVSLWLSAAFTTALLVQGDHPTDERAFWRSRPIDAWQLAVAKLTLLAALFVAVPFIANAARLAAYGAPARSIGASAVQFVVIGGALVVPAWLLALLTRSVAQFLAVAAACVLAWYATVAFIATFGPASWLDPRMYGGGDRVGFAPPLADWQRVDACGWLVALSVTVLATAAILGWYRTRRLVAPVLLGAGAVAVALVLPPSPETPAPAIDVVTLAAGQLEVVGPLEMPNATERAAIAARGERVPLGGTIIFRRPFDARLSASLGLDAVRFSVDGQPREASGVEYCCDADTWSDAHAATGTQPPLPPELSAQTRTLTRGRAVFATVTPGVASRMKDRAVSLRADARLRFLRHRRAGQLPVQAGAAFRGEGYLLELVSVDARTATARLRLSRFPTLERYGPTIRLFREVRRNGAPSSEMATVRDPFGFYRMGGSWNHGRDWIVETTVPLVSAYPHEAEQLARVLTIVESVPAGDVDTALVAADVPVRESVGPFAVGRRF